MTFIPDWQQVQEAEYFNWRCIICHDLAKSPLHLGATIPRKTWYLLGH